jgi:uncharacterized membrane protein (DUF485 family)
MDIVYEFDWLRPMIVGIYISACCWLHCLAAHTLTTGFYFFKYSLLSSTFLLFYLMFIFLCMSTGTQAFFSRCLNVTFQPLVTHTCTVCLYIASKYIYISWCVRGRYTVCAKKKRPTPKNGFGFLKISSSVNNDRIDNCFWWKRSRIDWWTIRT